MTGTKPTHMRVNNALWVIAKSDDVRMARTLVDKYGANNIGDALGMSVKYPEMTEYLLTLKPDKEDIAHALKVAADLNHKSSAELLMREDGLDCRQIYIAGLASQKHGPFLLGKIKQKLSEMGCKEAEDL